MAGPYKIREKAVVQIDYYVWCEDETAAKKIASEHIKNIEIPNGNKNIIVLEHDIDIENIAVINPKT